MKKFLVVLLACLLVLSLGVTAFAEPKVPAPNPVPGAREAVILNAGFHCNAHGGNGRVWVEAYDLKYEADKSLKKEGIGGVLEDLIYLDDNCWLLANKKDYVCPECGSSVWVSYSNKSGVPDGKNIQLTHGDKSIHKGKITMKKYVDEDGKIIEITADYAKYIECFNLYKVAGDGDPIEGKDPIDVARLNDGVFVFNNLEDGWYAVEEILTEAGKDIFVPAPVKYFLITNGVTYGCDVDFDYDAFYTIINGYGSGYVLGYPGLNNTGDIFPIGVRNTETGIEYPSFCANAGSRAFAGESGMGCSGYMVSKKIDRDCSTYADFVNAYNYIEDEFGSLNDNRAITQIISWILLGSIDIESEAFDNINWAIVESGAGSVNGVEDAKAKVVEVMENFADYSGKGKIVDIVFLVCEHEHDFYDCQPQLVPVYGKCGLINKLIPGGKVFPVSFIKEKYNGLLPVGAGEFAFDLFKITDGAEEK
ncbi:MAG: hypothetical protein FWF85_05260, partial [Clostridiales bacterium]|nr:hypothetical protein [Clostridiales bacterium]